MDRRRERGTGITPVVVREAISGRGWGFEDPAEEPGLGLDVLNRQEELTDALSGRGSETVGGRLVA